MKKLISVFAALVLVSAVAAKPAPAKRLTPAQMKAEAAAKAKAEAEAKAKATAAPAPAPSKKESNFQIGLYGGYSFQLSSSTGSTTNGGGIYGGGDFFYGEAFKIGLGVAYMQTNTTSGATQAILPINLKIRYHFVPSFYVGVNGGYALYMGTSITGVTITTIPVGGELGYVMDLGGVGLELGAQFTYALVSTKVDLGSLGTVTSSSNAMYATPFVRVAFRF